MADRPDTVALIVVDVQNDYLSADISPSRDVFLAGIRNIIADAREAGVPIAHMRTVVASDGSNAMPHRVSAPLCVDGTEGVRPPAEAREIDGEPVFPKRFFDSFDNPDVDDWLRAHGATTVVLAGAYTHACVHHTAVSAYARGYRVVIATDAVTSDRPNLAELSLDWLMGRVAEGSTSAEIRRLFGKSVDAVRTIDETVVAAERARHDWESSHTPDARAAILERWAVAIEDSRAELVEILGREIQKPGPLADDEVNRTAGHIRSAAKLSTVLDAELRPTASIDVVFRPLGVVALLMPWNNPLAIPAGKIAAALVSGNAVVLKPAPEAIESSRRLVELALEAGIPAGLLGLVEGGVAVAQALIRHPGVDGVALTGSIAAGRAIAEACTKHGKPLQAELGGNNAVIVAADADLDSAVPDLVRNAFTYSGQRCTAIRRWIVDKSIAEEFTRRALETTAVWNSANPDARLISSRAADRLRRVIAEVTLDGGEVLAGGTCDGDAMAPTVVTAPPTSRIVRTESFGPIAVIEIARDLDHAIELANAVEQGLVVGVCSSSQNTIDRVMNEAQAGIIQAGGRPVPVHPEAPFGGWKASGMGSPEHGVWDLQFFTRPQARYDLRS